MVYIWLIEALEQQDPPATLQLTNISLLIYNISGQGTTENNGWEMAFSMEGAKWWWA